MRFLSIICFSALLTMVSLRALATHISGGEISINHISGSSFEIKLNMQWSINPFQGPGSPGPIILDIFPRANPAQLVLKDTVYFTNAYLDLNYNCGSPLYQYHTVEYSGTMNLDSTLFSDPGGYLITNSSQLTFNSNFFRNSMEPFKQIFTFFTPYVNGLPNSTPNLDSLSTELICRQDTFSTQNLAIDPDGDSIVYGFFTPSSSVPFSGGIVNVYSAPYSYPPTQATPWMWSSGYGENSQIKGAPGESPLSINPVTGELTLVTEDVNGPYAIGVAVEEFRDINGDGFKEFIGGVYRIRAIQIDACTDNQNIAPEIQNPKLDGFPISSTQIITLPETWTGDTLEFEITDQNVFSVISVDYSFTDTSEWTIQNDNSLDTILTPSNTMNVRFSIVPNSPGPKILDLNIYATDNGCDNKQDSLRVRIFTNVTSGFEKERLDHFEVYPNPSKGEIVITEAENLIDRDFSVLNTLGEIKASGKIEGDILNLKSLKAGMYFLHIEGYKLKKIMIE